MEQQVSLGLQTRRATVESSTINEEARTFEVIWSTGAMVMRYDFWKDELFWEELSLDESAVRMERLNAGAPFLDSHDSFSLDAVLGSVERAWLTKDDARAAIKIVRGDERADRIWNKISQGAVRSISVGYRIHEMEEDERGYKPKGKKKPMRLMRAVDWEPFEISAVSVPADAGAKIREQETQVICTVRMIDRPELEVPSKPLSDGMRIELDPDAILGKLAAAEAIGDFVKEHSVDYGVLRARLALLKA